MKIESIQTFLKLKNIAVVGVSISGKGFGAICLQSFKG